MNICVLGLWHLGAVTAACMASRGHRVVGLDFDEQCVANLSAGIAPLFEPGLEELLREGLASGRLRFCASVEEATSEAEVLWVAYDTPVGADSEAQPQLVHMQLERTIPALNGGTLVLVSSQLPAGSTGRLRQSAIALPGGQELRWAYLPENLRLGSAVSDFLRPDRIVVGASAEADRHTLRQLLEPLGVPIEWMSIESAEMTKHALNAFLAVSVTFANEVATLCEGVGADAKQVERGLKSDRRIGPGAYLAPGAAFAGGTLVRDVLFLNDVASEQGVATPLLSAVLPSHALHRRWVQNTLRRVFSDLSLATVALWGLTYKPGTDTLRDSPAVELGDWLLRQGVTIRVHDPVVRDLPSHWNPAVTRAHRPLAAVRGAHALVVTTAWPIYRDIGAAELAAAAADCLVVLDPNRFLAHLAAAGSPVRYLAVGMPRKAL